MEFFLNLFNVNGFVPRWHCGTAWTAAHGCLHIAADLATFCAYFAVPCVVAYHVVGRKDLRFSRVFWVLLALVFLSCGSVHLVESLMFWWPAYRLSAVLKLLTASVSCIGVVVLARAMPRALSLKTPEELELVHAKRRRAEKSLEHERHLLHTIMDHLPDPMYFKDASGRFERVSKSFADRLGLANPEEAIGKSDSDFFPAEYAGQAARDEKDMLASGQPMVGKEENPTWPDGRQSWVLTTKSPYFDRHGHPAGTFGISHEITELKDTERALRDSQERFRLAVQGSTDGLWDWDIATDVVYYSPRFKELLGYDEDEMEDVFDSWKSRLHPEDFSPTLEAIDDHLQNCVPYDVEFRLLTKSGQYHWFRGRAQAVWNDRGVATRMAGSITDITDHRSAEDALKSSQRLYLSLVETLPVHLIRKDLAGKFTFANRAFCKLLGKSPEEIVGTTDFDYYPAKLAEKYRRDDQWVATTGKLFEDIEENNDGDVTRYFEVIKAPVHDASGTIIGTQGIFWDVTGRKRAELALQEAKESAEAANRAKSEFLANMSHEIRTPMNAIIGMTELVLETDLSANQRDYLATVLEAGESLLSIINEILDFSKIEAGRIELDTVSIELREVLGTTLKSLALRAHRKGLELAWRVDDDVPDALIGDPTRLRQIIVNLVGNAVKFTEQGEVVLSVSGRTRSDRQVELQFSVRDTGIGIPPDKLHEVFEEFQQADTSTTRRFGGTGLGLAIVSRLSELMGGRVWVESQLGQGSTFHFTCQVEVDRTSRHETMIEPSAIHGTPALVVDDNATNRRILAEMLGGWGMEVHCVASGNEALTRLREIQQSHGRLPVLISDVSMPEMDGFTLAEKIRQDETIRDVKIVMLTSRGSGDIAEYSRLGVSAHFIKPVKQSELFDAVASAVGGKVPRKAVVAAEITELRPLNVLLAEDGIANQKLALGVLRKGGHSVTVANNGKEAIEAWKQADYDVILMDIQMPEMDGLEATKVIREKEKETQRHIPIVAMTAHAMTGDREKCLAAGMDGYVSKPVRKQALYEAIETLVRENQTAPTEDANVSELDVSTALEATDGDVELLKEVVLAFLEESPQLVKQLRQAVDRSDAAEVQRAAHTIKGSMRLFPKSPVHDLSIKLENMGRDKELAGAADVVESLEQAMQELMGQLRAYLGG